MCGIFGIISSKPVAGDELLLLARQAERRGKDSSGLYFSGHDQYSLYRAPIRITNLLRRVSCKASHFVMGHSRLITNGLSDDQPVYRDATCVIHNGIVVNYEILWKKTNRTKNQEIDTEIIAAIAADALDDGVAVEQISQKVLEACRGTVACALAFPKLGKLYLFSNNGSLYVGKKDGSYYFSSEQFPLILLGCIDVDQVRQNGKIIDIPKSTNEPAIHEIKNRTENLIPAIGKYQDEENLLVYPQQQLRRCKRCILPETMPFIKFDKDGVCNYCRNYKLRNKPRPVEEFLNLIESYRRITGNDCIVPFSGGRDSSYGLHLITKELKMKPITYTYDWGMVTDLGRRNVSRMCAELGVENIIIADDISWKRGNIARNFKAWLQSPNLGMVSILTAGDKQFFRHVEDVKKRTGISLNLWGVNPLEVTHFKAGFLGVPPDFEEVRVYSNGVMKQLRYQWLRLRAMAQSPSYFNRSLWDTLSGEYYRSFAAKTDYFHIFDFWRWDENLVNDTLINQYNWEKASDTNSTWRIGDGTAALYNYIYYTVAGFTEHDTFRSNQIREGDITRVQALELIQEENRPRYQNIKWYLDAIGIEFKPAIKVINNIPRLYKE
jgi:glucosamine--fructose-6-phosphate aminotransferase (isomerizing)